MLLLNVYRRSLTTAHASLVHVDYHSRPSRSWEVASFDVDVPIQESARDVAVRVARRLLGALEESDERFGVVCDGQLSLW